MSGNGYVNSHGWVASALEQYEGQLTRYAQRITGDAERARDVVQETFLRLCRETPDDLDGHVAQWLFTVCRNKALDVRRKEGRMTTFTELPVANNVCDTASPEAIAESRDETNHVFELLDHLPDNQREVIYLKFQNGLSYKQISEITGLSVSNVGFLIHRGLKTIRACFAEEENHR